MKQDNADEVEGSVRHGGSAGLDVDTDAGQETRRRSSQVGSHDDRHDLRGTEEALLGSAEYRSRW